MELIVNYTMVSNLNMIHVYDVSLYTLKECFHYFNSRPLVTYQETRQTADSSYKHWQKVNKDLIAAMDLAEKLESYLVH